MARKPKPPTYYRRVIRGREVAYVTLSDNQTKARRDFWLGDWGSPESRDRYLRLLSEWERAGRRLPDGDGRRPPGVHAYTVAMLAADYVREHPPRFQARCALRVLLEVAADYGAEEFGPRALKQCRAAMLAGNPHATPPRAPWNRDTANKRTRLIVAVYRWAVAEERIPAVNLHALAALKPLRGEEPGSVEPVPPSMVEATLAELPSVLQVMVRVQQLTGLRSTELCMMRPCDLDLSGDVWTYAPAKHKTSHLRKRRTVWIGPKAQELIRPHLNRPTDAYLFSPAEAVAELLVRRHAERVTPTGHGNEPGTNRVEQRRRPPRPRYDKDSYARAITRACRRAYPPPEHLARREGEAIQAWLARLTKAERAELRQWWREHHWHPHQLRHSYGTTIRQMFGLEDARVMLGHSSAMVTDAVYAERDGARAARIAGQVG